MQLSPRLTSASVSPWVATTLPSLTPTMTPQPVPQKRQAALDHFSSSETIPPAIGCAMAGTVIPAAAAATAAAWALSISRRESAIVLVSKVCDSFDLFEHHVGGQHAGPCGDLGEAAANHPAFARFHDDHDLRFVLVVNFDVGLGGEGAQDVLALPGQNR